MSTNTETWFVADSGSDEALWGPYLRVSAYSGRPFLFSLFRFNLDA